MSATEKKGPCPHCKKIGINRPRKDCYLHCHERKDGVHQPDASSIVKADTGPDDFTVDVTCKDCGNTGGHNFKPEEIYWE